VRHATPAALIVASAAFVAVACAGPRDDGDGDGDGEAVAARAQAIIGGQADGTDDAVVALSQKSTGALCSGALVAPSVVLTAAHCVYGVAASDLSVVVGADVTAPVQTVGVAAVSPYPTYRGVAEGVPGGVDLAAVTLAQPLGVAPLAVATMNVDAAAGASVTVVGYGADDGATSAGTGTRRDVTLSIVSTCTRVLTAGGADANVCVGDSGGAVLLGGALVALVSGGQEGCYTPATFTRLDAHADWVRAVLAGDADAAAACPTCVAPDPSCGAATETQPALPAAPDASTSPPSGGGGGGCSAVPSAAGPSSWWVLLIVAAASRASRARVRPPPARRG
jgi:secreted trypsin-like serine protease